MHVRRFWWCWRLDAKNFAVDWEPPIAAGEGHLSLATHLTGPGCSRTTWDAMAPACPLPLGRSFGRAAQPEVAVLVAAPLLLEGSLVSSISGRRQASHSSPGAATPEAQTSTPQRIGTFVELASANHPSSVAGTSFREDKLPVSPTTMLRLLCFLHSVFVSRFQFQEDKLPASTRGEKLESCSTVTGGLQRDSLLSSPFFFFRWICLLLRLRRNSLLALRLWNGALHMRVVRAACANRKEGKNTAISQLLVPVRAFLADVGFVN